MNVFNDNDDDHTWEPGLPLPEYHGALPQYEDTKKPNRAERVFLLVVMLLLVLGLGLTYSKASKPVVAEGPEGVPVNAWLHLHSSVMEALIQDNLKMTQRLTDLERRQLTLENYHLGHSDKEFPIEPRVNQQPEFQPPRSTTHPPLLPDFFEVKP